MSARHRAWAIGSRIGAAAMMLVAGSAQADRPCSASPPADLDAAPAHWLGACPGGLADGPGVLRAGTAEPYAFFAGRMRAGRPVRGLLMLSEGNWMVAVRFDPALRALQQDGLHPEQDDRVFADAQTAAKATAQRFRAVGNTASAAYYERLAKRIVDGRPE